MSTDEKILFGRLPVAIVEEADLLGRLTHAELKVYIAMALHVRRPHCWKVWPSYGTLAERAHVTERYVFTVVSKLRSMGVITTEPGGGHSLGGQGRPAMFTLSTDPTLIRDHPSPDEPCSSESRVDAELPCSSESRVDAELPCSGGQLTLIWGPPYPDPQRAGEETIKREEEERTTPSRAHAREEATAEPDAPGRENAIADVPLAAWQRWIGEDLTERDVKIIDRLIGDVERNPIIVGQDDEAQPSDRFVAEVIEHCIAGGVPPVNRRLAERYLRRVLSRCRKSWCRPGEFPGMNGETRR